MFCPNCGHKNSDGVEFCAQCGKKFQSQTTTTDQIAKKSSAFFKKTTTNLKNFIVKYKKQEIIVASSLAGLALLIWVFSLTFGFETLKWKTDQGQYSLKYVTATTVELGVDFSNEEKLSELTVETTCGEASLTGATLAWDLSESVGECQVTVSHKLRKISKTFTVLNIDNNNQLSLSYEIDEDSDEDLDYDELTNKQEKEYGTNPQLADTDGDNLDDGYEINVLKTDPLKKDTDGDGLDDYSEIELGFDPLKADSLGDGIKDGNREIQYAANFEKYGVSVSVSGKGNLPTVTANSFTNQTFAGIDGVLGTVYNFYADAEISSATVTISYADLDLQAKDIDENNLTLYYFNDETKELEAVKTTVNINTKTITAELEHFSKYVLGDKDLVTLTNQAQILFVLDNSVSMYTDQQMIDAGYDTSTGALGNDKDFKRITLTNKMIDMFTGSYTFSAAEFSGDYVNIHDFSDNKEDVKKSVSAMRTDWKSSMDGTNIIGALNSGIAKFSKDDSSHYLVLLTDGRNTEGSLSSSSSSIIKKATEKDVKICVIGLGSNVDSDDLNKIAESTGCDYYNASDASALDEIYAIVGADINYGQVDGNADGKIDSTIIADSGFIASKNGFSFHNYGTTYSEGGHCYGMALVAELYYTGKMPQKAGSITTDKDLEPSNSFNLKNTYFATGKNLYDFKLQSEALKYAFSFSDFGEDRPADLYEVKDNKLYYSETHLTVITDSGLFQIKNLKSTLSAEQQVARHGAAYGDYQQALLDEDLMQSSSAITNDEKQILNAIYTGYIRQGATKHYISSSNFVTFLRKTIGVEKYKKIDASNFIELLSSRLADGDAPVIASSFYGNGLHAINAISLAQDNENANKYYVGVYDNNYPGEIHYIGLECTKSTCKLTPNDIFLGDDEPVRITMSLEDDAAYFAQ